jgi:hypothetical protein
MRSALLQHPTRSTEFLFILAQRGYNVTGVDHSQYLLSKAKELKDRLLGVGFANTRESLVKII